MSKHPIWCGLLPLSAFLGNLNPLVVNIFGLVFSEQNPLLVAHYIALACWLPFACDHRLVAQTPVVSEQRSSTTRNLRLKNSQLFQQKTATLAVFKTCDMVDDLDLLVLMVGNCESWHQVKHHHQI